MKKLRVGVIGLGIGRGHVKGYQGHEGAEVVAIADIDEGRLATAGEQLGVEGRYTDAEEMLAKENLDVVSVATPNRFHRPLTIAALEAGCHVLCEKPMAMNADEAREMLAAAERADRRVMINFSYRFNAPARALKQEVDRGTFGEFYFGRTTWLRRRGMPKFGGWFGQKELAGGGPLIDLGVHRIDLALWLMGYPKPAWIMGCTYDPIAREIAAREGKAFDVEDLASAMIRFENGASLLIEASWAGHSKERERMETHLLGTKAGLLHGNRNETYDFYAEIYTDRDGQAFDLTPHAPLRGGGSAQRHFIDAILDDTPHIATGEEGLIVMQILDAIYASAESGAPIEVE